MKYVLIGAGALAVFLSTAFSANADMLVWSETAMVKVGPTDPAKPTPAGISISAAQNEYEPFQIIIQSPGRTLRGLDVDLSDFVSIRNSRIDCRENCTIYRELYIRITQPSGPYGMTGEWPDALIPKVDRYAGEKRNAFPYDVPQGRNQPVWIDVYVPPATTPGQYIAYATVKALGELPVRIPVYLTVFAFSLPATSSLQNSFGVWATGLPVAHGPSFVGEALDELVKTYSKSLLAHRLSNGQLLGTDDWLPAALIKPTAESPERLRRDWGSFFDGSVLSNGAKITAVIPTHSTCLQGPICRPDFIDLFARAGWRDRLSIYLPDEPNLSNPTVLQTVTSIADAIHLKDRALRTMISVNYSRLLEQQVDTWLVPLPELQLSIDNGTYESTYGQMAAGKQFWVYQSCSTHEALCGFQQWYPGLSGWPDYMIDMQGMKNRIQDWINWKYKVKGEVYWGVNYGYYLGDPFESQFAWGGNGEGNFFYPGTPQRIGGRTHIPIESIRLKLKREGLEDFEYLTLLARSGNSAFADETVAKLVKAATNWEQDPVVLYRLREEMATKIEPLQVSPVSRRW